MRENYLFTDLRREKCLFCKSKVYKEEGGKGGRGREKGRGRGKKEREGRRKKEQKLKPGLKSYGCTIKSNGAYRK